MQQLPKMMKNKNTNGYTCWSADICNNCRKLWKTKIQMDTSWSAGDVQTLKKKFWSRLILAFSLFVELSFLIVNIIHVAFHAHFTLMWWKKIMILSCASISWLEAGGRLVTCLFQLAHPRTFLGLFLLCQFSTHDWVKLGCVEICWLCCSSWLWWLCCIWLPFTKIFSTPDGFWFWINFNMWMCGSLLTVLKLIGWLVSLCVKEENLIGVCLWGGQLWCRRKVWHGQKTIF